MKEKIDYELVVNGLLQKISYKAEAVENLFLPLLRRLSQMQKQSGGRIILFLVAPPATGKSTLTLFLEKLSREYQDLIPAQAVGMDGFHYHSEFIKNNFVIKNGQKIPMAEVKGSPDTFDTKKLREKLRALKNNQEVFFPIYDRKIHDVIEEKLKITENIILFEGNWLLLNNDRWLDLKEFADYSLMIKAEPEFLKQRLINRKIQGGLSATEALEFYEKSDKENVLTTLNNSFEAREVWELRDLSP